MKKVIKMEEKSYVRKSTHRRERVEQKELVDETVDDRIFKLSTPLLIKDSDGKIEEIEKLEFPKKIKVKHLRSFPPELFDEGGTSNLNPVEFVPFISTLVGVDSEYLEEIDAGDWNDLLERVREIYNFF